MRKVAGSDAIIDRMITGDNEIIFNLISLIRSDANAVIITDDRSYIVAQTHSSTPIWIYLNENKDAQTENDLVHILSDLIEKNKSVHINVQDGFIQRVFERLLVDKGYLFSEYMPMNVYVCHEVKAVEGKGKLVLSSAEYKERVVLLMKQMAKDAENYDMTNEEAEEMANAFEDSDDLFLWNDNEIVALARIAHRNEKYARINTVVTDREYRGNGYAKMLVGKISQNVLDSGLIPMLYADARNPYSNAVYQRSGYLQIGQITEYAVSYGIKNKVEY